MSSQIDHVSSESTFKKFLLLIFLSYNKMYIQFSLHNTYISYWTKKIACSFCCVNEHIHVCTNTHTHTLTPIYITLLYSWKLNKAMLLIIFILHMFSYQMSFKRYNSIHISGHFARDTEVKQYLFLEVFTQGKV